MNAARLTVSAAQWEQMQRQRRQLAKSLRRLVREAAGLVLECREQHMQPPVLFRVCDAVDDACATLVAAGIESVPEKEVTR